MVDEVSLPGAHPTATVDLRSDTVTRPTPAMRAAMLAAEVGDDGFGDDPTVRALEERVAALLHKEAALFVPSGTMANQLAIRLHTQPGDAVIVHADAHIVRHEAGAAPALSGVTLITLPSLDGALGLEAVAAALQADDGSVYPPTTLVCIENPHNMAGGRIVAQHSIDAVAAIARRAGTALHLDGARLWNAEIASGRAVAELAAPFTTVSVCMSKGLGAPAGSLLAGPAPLVRRTRRLRRMLGGMMRQVGILAAGGLYALDHHRERLVEDHRRAELLASALAELPWVTVTAPDTNIVRFRVSPEHPLFATSAQGDVDLVALAAARGVRITGQGMAFRAVTHLDVDDARLDHAITVLATLLGGERNDA